MSFFVCRDVGRVNAIIYRAGHLLALYVLTPIFYLEGVNAKSREALFTIFQDSPVTLPECRTLTCRTQRHHFSHGAQKIIFRQRNIFETLNLIIRLAERDG